MDAIEVCHSVSHRHKWDGAGPPALFHMSDLSLYQVLTEYPNYPKIREEILEKAQGSLRP